MTIAVADLLIEIGTEELPPKALKKLRDAFATGVAMGLNSSNLTFTSMTSFVSPRRLALVIENLVIQQEAQKIQRKGPTIAAAYDKDANPSKAALGFARSCGVEFDQLQTLETDNGAWLIFEKEQAGQSTQSLLPAIINDSLDKLPIPKRMTWGNHRIAFVRPVHWIVALFNNAVLDINILGKQASNTSRGHRFLSQGDIVISSPSSYADTLKQKGHVIADFEERKAIIHEQVKSIAKELGGTAQIDDELLDEVTGLVEWPVGLAGNFDRTFLEVPQECLISAMKEHQKYFPVLDSKGKLLPVFIAISNINSQDPKQVVQGNEKVIRPRLADSAFFFNADKKQSFTALNQLLKKVVFQDKLGTVYEKTQRISQLAGFIAKQIGGNVAEAERAGALSKADLVSNMVGEFPNLQGLMGRYYAQNAGESVAVSMAIEEQYLPRFSGDNLPRTLGGTAVSIADKLDTLVGIFGVGLIPTGDKDPFALRRCALGILRIIIENKLQLDLVTLIHQAIEPLQDRVSNHNVKEELFEFFMSRFRTWYQQEGVDTDVIISVEKRRPSQPYDFDQRINAIKTFKTNPAAPSLAAANKRVGNILKKSPMASDTLVNNNLLQEKAEIALATALNNIGEKVRQHFYNGQYSEGLETLSTLRPEIDLFFTEVMVMVEDEAIKQNRLALLNQLRELFLLVADISELSI